MNFEEDKELSYIEKQTILYFKGHFRVTDMMKDLKVFAGSYYDLEVDQVEHYSIYNFVVKLYFKMVSTGHIDISYEKFVLELFNRGRTFDYIGMIEKLRAIIQDTKTMSLELGEPDFSLLPKKEEINIKNEWEQGIDDFMEVNDHLFEDKRI